MWLLRKLLILILVLLSKKIRHTCGENVKNNINFNGNEKVYFDKTTKYYNILLYVGKYFIIMYIYASIL